ncbi:MAG TPA: HDIG domain-containing protein [Cyclobacteriaceae bacterium]|nr:HDIG domain-containing protein [Cyclobacteriaceae bacterium]
MMKDPKEIVDEVFDLYARFGNADYIGEPVSQIEHMSQSAQLAIDEGFDDEVVLAAFFHDIGHICVMNAGESMGGYGKKSHERIGADYLRSCGFPERVAKLVENHVQAKRYLTFKYPDYYQQLSEASKRTLEYQGGVMSEAEAGIFESDPLFGTSILMRKWDELAKEISIPVIDMGVLREKALLMLKK